MSDDLLEDAAKKIKKVSIPWKAIGFVVVLFVILFAVITAALVTYGKGYEDRVLPGVHIGDISLGGMDAEELAGFLGQMVEKQTKAGITLAFEYEDEEKRVTLEPARVPEEKDLPVVHFDVDAEVERLISFRKGGSVLSYSWSVFAHKYIKPEVALEHITLDEAWLAAAISEKMDDYTTKPQDAKIDIESVDPLTFDITSSSRGFVYDTENVHEDTLEAWSRLETAEFILEADIAEPEVTKADLTAVETELVAMFEAGEHTIAYYNSHTKQNHTWKITKKDIADWLVPVRDVQGNIVLELSASSTLALFEEEIAPKVNVEPRNASMTFNAAKTKVTDFTSSRPGVTVDIEETMKAVNNAFAERLIEGAEPSTKTELVVAVVEPDIKTEDTNDLGIKEILGIGSSNFSGSPRNRIGNIKNAVFNKLWGTLVAPGAEFSLNATLRPYTAEAGYLPELVIVGDRIKPEIAGGLCQVGTTIFRTVMNSGLPVTARTNHGLVVSYYNDPSNGNPGTDATIYDGWPDFKFLNDTGHHVLITTAMNVSTGDLRFTIWGTNDGRKGYYTAPQVHQWIGAGEYREIQTTDLAPGEKQCQSVHPGAVASFTYIREMPGGEKISKVYKSSYRAVPATCYVGVEEITQCQENGEGGGCAPAGPKEDEKPTYTFADDLEKIKEEAGTLEE